MAERLAYLPLVVLMIVCGGILLVYAGQEHVNHLNDECPGGLNSRIKFNGKWVDQPVLSDGRQADGTHGAPRPPEVVGVAMTNTYDEYVEKAARLAGRRPPPDMAARIAELLGRRPDLAGLGVTYVLEAVCA